MQTTCAVPLFRFAQKFDVDESSGCWNWTVGLTDRGYGTFACGGGGRSARAHKWIYEHVVEPVPEGLELHHVCENRRCINPDHLEPMTHPENVRLSSANKSEAMKKMWAKRKLLAGAN